MYRNFNKYVLRAPLFSLNYFLNLTSDNDVSDADLFKEFNNPVIREAIFLASPVLYTQIEKWCSNKIKSEKEELKIKISFLKYLSRISSRPTPFGIFAGTCIGNISNSNSIILDSKNNSRKTRLDMSLTALLIKIIEKDISIKRQLLYYPNTTIYKIANQIRYVECIYINQKLKHQVVEVEDDEYLSEILSSCKKGMYISDLTKVLQKKDIQEDEANNFIEQLIENQILVSEIRQTVSGEETIDRLLTLLEKIETNGLIKKNLLLIKEKLSKLDSKLGNNIELYSEIIETLKLIGITTDEKYIFQTDMFLNPLKNLISKDVESILNETLLLLNKISNTKENSNLTNFKNAYIERYENKEMPLSLVLDEEIGLGYPLNSNGGEINLLVDDLSFNVKPQNKYKNIEWSALDSILLKKMSESIEKKLYTIELFDHEFVDFSNNWNNLSDTFSTITQIVTLNGEQKIVMDSIIGSSAGNLLGRFCSGNHEINQFVEEIIDCEETLNPNKIIAEIVHLPENRTGNILMRPSFRKYEIPYLSHSTIKIENQISIDDIVISITNNEIILKSKIENLEILPRLTNAHNFRTSSLPVYRFLCDMQFYKKKPFLNFEWGSLNTEFSFLPRVIYKDAILSTAKWILDSKEITILESLKKEDDKIKKISNWRLYKNIPQYAYLVDGDNKILLNFLNLSCINILFSEINFKQKIIFEEFLFIDNICKDKTTKENFVNEVIFSFVKNHK